MLLYAITRRVPLGKSEVERENQLIALAAAWAANGVDYIQIREKDLSPSELTRLAAKIVQATRQNRERTQVLINALPEDAAPIALEAGAAGVHLASGLNPDQLAEAISQLRGAWQAGRNLAMPPILSVSCHSTAEVRAARAAGATLALFAPVFEKVLNAGELRADTTSHPARSPGRGLKALAEACRAAREPSQYFELPVLALGGVTLENAARCQAAGAAGIAGIRLFLEETEGQKQRWR